MKKYLFYTAFILALASCEPQMDSIDLNPPLTEQQVQEQIASKIEVVPTVAGGNKIVLKNGSPYSGKWTLASKVSTKIVDTIIYFPGTYKVKFEALTDGGIVTVYKDLKIDNLTDPLTPPVSYLMGPYGEGVTWVYAKDHPKNNWWGMVNHSNWQEFWWNPHSGKPVFDVEQTFKYDNGFKYSIDGQTGSFEVDDAKMQIKFSDLPLHLSVMEWNEAKSNTFKIMVLNQNELVLLLERPDGFNWMWRLKRKGFSY